ncbi:uracil-DNA glycosylase [bacterium]|nr:uracil-DNA glycosylase [bacterium]
MRNEVENYLRYLADMGEKDLPVGEIEAAQREKQAQTAPEKRTQKVSAEDKGRLLGELAEQIARCTKCELHRTRTNTVPGAGNPDADIMFIGEAPGADEDATGIPFVGRAGKLLDKFLAAIDIDRDEVFIANVLKCRPPNNRDPLPSEEAACMPYLLRQIEIIQPKIICCLGRVAAQALLKTKAPLSKMRGQMFSFHSIPMIITYHPAAVLRNNRLKRSVMDDLRFLMSKYEEILEGEG